MTPVDPLNSPPPQISAVVPIYNEEQSLPQLHARLTKVFSKLGLSYELVFVNDGSADRTLEIIKELVARDPHLRAISLSRNFGHQTALTAGLDHARGEMVAMMDADLQDPPELLPRMIAKMNEGFDVVYAVRTERAGESAFKRATAALFYRLLRFCTAINIPLDTGDFRLINRRALDSVLSIRERNRFLRGLFTWVGFRQTGVPYKRPARFAGETKYPLRKMLRFAVDGMTSFSTVPLQFAILAGFGAAALGFLYGIKVLVNWMDGSTVPGWSSTIMLILFFGGVQLICTGILGEYVGRIFEEVKARPLYFVRERIGFDGEASDGQSIRKAPQ
ncbi:MAG: glycosyltransferase [Sumerlaeia bacterium]